MTTIPIKSENLKNSTSRGKPLPVVEIFGDTIQGEGPSLSPAIFLRTGLCNLKCQGFGCTRISPQGETIVGCDTIHAVSPKFKDQWTYYKDSSTLIEDIQRISNGMQGPEYRGNPPQIVYTGGESLLHWGNPIMQETLEYFIMRGHDIVVETNATRMIDFNKEWMHNVQFSMSVKLDVSGEPRKLRLNWDAINNLIENGRDSYFKFVVDPQQWDTTKSEIFEILDSTKSKNVDVFLMPLGETRAKQLANTQSVFKLCAYYGFKFSPRAHILAFDDADGV